MRPDREYPREEHTPSLIDLLRILRTWAWLVVIVTVCFTGMGLGYSLMQPTEYEASVKILIGQEHQRDPLSSLTVESLQQTTQTMAEAINSRSTAEDVIQQLDSEIGPQDLLNHMNVEQVGVTQFIEVSYVSQDPERAQQITNTIGDVVSNQAPDLNISANVITATVHDEAVVPDSPVSPHPIRNMALALVTGLLLGVGLAFLLEYLRRASKPYGKVKG